MIQIDIKSADVCSFACDMLILKYAQAFYGADSIVAAALTQENNGELEITPPEGEYRIVTPGRTVVAKQVLFVGVSHLSDFEYSAIRKFTTRSLVIASEALPHPKHVAMTLHGVNYGLDERESFMAQLGGVVDAEARGVAISRLTIVEIEVGRAARLSAILNEARPRIWPKSAPPITAGANSRTKPHIFVAMPFSKDLDDVFVFGIQGPVNASGYLCERVDMSTFTGDVLDRIKSRIESAKLVIADLTGANANVYLEVGYAWGKNRPTLLLSRKSDDLKFDVKGQRCLVYDSIVDLSKKLKADLAALDLEP